MSDSQNNYFNRVVDLLSQNYRGVNIAVCALATTGLAVAVHRIRPVSKYSRAGSVPKHIIRENVPLNAVCAGVQHSPVRVLVHHKAPIYLPLWHSSKPPLNVKLWGVDVVSGNAINWLECVARGQRLTLRPLGRDKEDLVSSVVLHLKQNNAKTTEDIDIAKTLVELGFAKAAIPEKITKNTLESQLAPVLLAAEANAKRYRNGVWNDQLPPLPAYVVYARKTLQLSKQMLVSSLKKLFYLFVYLSRSVLAGSKSLILRSIRPSPKAVQSTT